MANAWYRFPNVAAVALGVVALAQPLTARAGEPAVASTNLLANPSFEQEAAITHETSLPGWEIHFRRNADPPLLTPDEIAVIDDPAQAHSGLRFLRIQARDREIMLKSPVARGYAPGLYEVSFWARGRPGTRGGAGLGALNALFGAGLAGLDEQWKKFSMVVYSKGVSNCPWPDQTQFFVGLFQPGQREQIPEPLLDIDDVSIALLTSGLSDAFGDHMVLQRDRPVPVWGWAMNPGQRIAVEFNGQTKTTAADKDGRWKVVLDPMEAGGPFVLTLDGRPTAYDVMVGDVWVCSGQSNMEFGIDLVNGYYNHAPEVVARANHPDIRLWQAPKQFGDRPLHRYLVRQSIGHMACQARWDVCTPATVVRGIWGGFSAVGYFFGRDIQASRKVPVGLMMIANGGTEIESFISEEGLRKVPQEQWVVPPLSETARANLQNTPLPTLPEDVEAPSAAYAEAVLAETIQQTGGVDNNSFHYASVAFNGLVAPVFPYAVRGVLWYQGEHNGNDRHYAAKLKALIDDWRTRFGQPDLPFIIAQLPYWRTADPAAWQYVREAQLHVSQTVPGTAMVVTLDLADEEGDGYGMGEIHPKRKQEVGQRMALAARAVAYGEKIVSSGPIYRAMRVDEDRAVLAFDSVGGGLEARGGKLVGFQIAGADRKFVDAEASIEGETVVLHSPDVPNPVAVRYGFVQARLPVPNLYNEEGLPASPFRTDDFDD
ncbi:MAG: sialate O-acetylesterase [Kiritimatiellia bacterium]|jgi:sialate O-acetylesterase